MSRSNHILESVISKIDALCEDHIITDDRETRYTEEGWNKSLIDNNFDPAEVERLDEHRNTVLAAATTDFGERSDKAFKEDENLQERRGQVYLGKYDKVNLLASRSYEDSEGKVIKNHLLIEHNHENDLLGGVQSWISALADLRD